MNASKSPVKAILMKDLFAFQERRKAGFQQHEIIVTLCSKVYFILNIYFHLSRLLMTAHFFIKNDSTTSYKICI